VTRVVRRVVPLGVPHLDTTVDPGAHTDTDTSS
jgi:hypothetical protein